MLADHLFFLHEQAQEHRKRQKMFADQSRDKSAFYASLAEKIEAMIADIQEVCRTRPEIWKQP